MVNPTDKMFTALPSNQTAPKKSFLAYGYPDVFCTAAIGRGSPLLARKSLRTEGPPAVDHRFCQDGGGTGLLGRHSHIGPANARLWERAL